MARQKLNNKNIRKLNRTGSGKTYAVSLPIEGIRKFNWQKKQKVIVDIDYKNKRFIIKDWSAKK